jgi:hypothetical protein
VADTLETLSIEGWRLGPYGPGLDPAVFNTFNAINPPDNTTPDLTEAFLAPPGGVPEVLTPRPPPAPPAPPRPAPLPEVLVTGARAAPLLPALGGLGALLVPLPTAAEGNPADLTPVFPAPLETVTVTGRRPPAPPPLIAAPAAPAGDSTPNWLQPLTWREYVRFGLEAAGRAARRVLRRDLQGEIADALRPDRITDRRVADSRGSAATALDRGGVPAAVLDTVTVTSRRPAPVSPVSPFAPSVLPDALLDFELSPFRLPDAVASPSTRTSPRTAPAPVTRDAPLVGTPTDIVTWLTPLIDTPVPRVPPRAAPPPPRLTPDPVDIFDPILTLTPFENPPGAPPVDKTNTCNCPPPKKRKPRQPRTVCRSGTYTQSRKGISYSPKRTFPCP